MRRRAFIAALGGAAALPFAARSQPSGKRPTLGYLGISAASGGGPWTAAFVQRLRELGWIEGRTIDIEYRWAEGRSAAFAEVAADFVQRKVDVIVTFGGAVPAMKRATSTIPIVFTVDADPVGRGLVDSLARPGGNVTGLSPQSTELVGKRLELLREIIPDFRRLSVLTSANIPGSVQEVAEVRTVSGKLGVDIVDALEMRTPEDIAPAFAALKGGGQALYLTGDALTSANRSRINTFALVARLPTMGPNRAYLEGGGLVSYGVNYADLYRRAGDYADRILRGARPADIPVEQAAKFELVINITTAKALGLKVSEAFLLRADEVIE